MLLVPLGRGCMEPPQPAGCLHRPLKSCSSAQEGFHECVLTLWVEMAWDSLSFSFKKNPT